MSLIYCFKSTPTPTPPHPTPPLHSPRHTHAHTFFPLHSCFRLFSAPLGAAVYRSAVPNQQSQALRSASSIPPPGADQRLQKTPASGFIRHYTSKCFLIIDPLIMNKARCLLAVRRKEEIQRLTRKQPSGEVEERPGSLTAE